MDLKNINFYLLFFSLFIPFFSVYPLSTELKHHLTKKEIQWLNNPKNKITIGITTIPPQILPDKNGNYKGIAIDFIKLIEKKLGLKFNLKYKESWNNLMKSAYNKEIDVVYAAQKTKEREKFFIFTKPYMDFSNQIISRKKCKKKIESIKDLKGLKVAVSRGSVLEKYLRKNFPSIYVIPSENELTALLKVSFFEADAAIMEYARASYYIENKKITNLKIVAPANYEFHLGFAVIKDKKLIAKVLNFGLSKITKSEKEQIMKKWIFGVSKFDAKPFFIALLILVFLIIFVFFWNRLLKIKVKSKTKELKLELEARKKAEKQLREKEEDLRITLNSIGDAVIATNEKGLICKMNSVAEQLTGWKFKEALNKPLNEVFDIINDETKEIVDSPFDKVMKTGKIQGLANHTLLIRKDGKMLNIADSGSPIKDEEGNIRGVVLVFRDITEKHLLEEQLQQANKMETLGLMAGGIAHDFNNMLAGILGAVELLEMRMNNDDKNLKFVKIIKTASENASKLTKNLLAFSRKEVDDKSTFDLHECITEAQELISKNLQDINVKTNFEAEFYTISGDSSLIENTIINLLLNAKDSILENNKKLKEIIITTKNVVLDEIYCKMSVFNIAPGNYIQLSIKDSGKGIDRLLQNRIFEPFFTTKPKGVGTGMGLSSVYGTIKQHKGEIKVYSEIGKGTVFDIFLPIKNYNAPTMTEQNNENVNLEGLCSGKVLVIDDEEMVRNINSLILRELGFEVIVAENGKIGLEKFKQHKGEICFILLDMIMPVMNGEECFNEIIAINPNVKIVLASGFTGDAEISKMKEKGLSGFLRKPYGKKQLQNIIFKLFSKS